MLDWCLDALDAHALAATIAAAPCIASHRGCCLHCRSGATLAVVATSAAVVVVAQVWMAAVVIFHVGAAVFVSGWVFFGIGPLCASGLVCVERAQASSADPGRIFWMYFCMRVLPGTRSGIERSAPSDPGLI